MTMITFSWETIWTKLARNDWKNQEDKIYIGIASLEEAENSVVMIGFEIAWLVKLWSSSLDGSGFY